MYPFLRRTPAQAYAASVDVRLRDGLHAVLRPLGPGEVEPLQAVFDGLSPASRTDRYLAGLPRLTSTMRDALAAVDGHQHLAWLGSVRDRPAGIARVIRVAPATVEIAYEVVDAHQGRGLGAALVDAVTTVASVSGIERVRASVLPSNHRSRHLLDLLGVPLRTSDGLLEGEGPLRLMDPPRVDRAAVVRVALAPPASSDGPIWPWTPAAASAD